MATPFDTWRSEIAAEFETAKADLAATQQELANAQAQATASQAVHQDTVHAISRAMLRRPLAAAIMMRHQGGIERFRAGEGRLTRARNGVARCMEKIEDLQQALEQLNEIDPPPAPAEPVAA
jgi:chromosome segregation ATPase